MGIEWDFHEGKFSLAGGSVNADVENFTNLGKTLFFTETNTQDLASEWLAKIRALLIDGKAAVLSRPSVLALNNRQASVRIGTDIPIATSQEVSSTSTVAAARRPACETSYRVEFSRFLSLQRTMPVLIDEGAARYFFHSSEHYYAAAIQEIEQAIETLETELLRSKFRHILQDHPGSSD